MLVGLDAAGARTYNEQSHTGVLAEINCKLLTQSVIDANYIFRVLTDATCPIVCARLAD